MSNNIAEHYNKIKPLSRNERSKSKIIAVREVNNFVKHKLIEKYVHSNSVVLDLGCGKGGDLGKLAHRNIKQYYGCDIASNSLDEALSRSMHHKYKADFINADYTAQNIKIGTQADVVMLQFSLHYAFATEQCVEKAIKNISRNLKDNGTVIITIPDSEVIKRREKKKGSNAHFGNTLYRIESTCKFSEETGYGESYKFYLAEAVEGCEEYLVNCKTLTKKLHAHGIFLVMDSGFLSILNAEIKADPDTYKKIVRHIPGIEEIQTIELYKGVVYRKGHNKEIEE